MMYIAIQQDDGGGPVVAASPVAPMPVKFIPWLYLLFSEPELMFMFAICRRLSSVCLSSVCNVRAPYSAD